MNTLKNEVAAIPVRRKLKVEHQQAKQKALIDKANSILLDANESDIDFLKERGYVKPVVANSLGSVFSEYLTQRDIEKLAIAYRLRFLPLDRFSSDLPYEAVVKMREAEEKHKPVNGYYNEKSKYVNSPLYYVLAPHNAFELEERPKDPILFLQVRHDRFLPIHSWGKDILALRKLLMLPLRNTFSMLFTGIILLAISILCLIVIDLNWLTYTLGSVFFVGIIVGTVGTITWNSAENWNSSYKLKWFGLT